LIFEDLHWADHSTVDLISAVAHRRPAAVRRQAFFPVNDN
jgi:predicted ATPase